jgi:hypothetical protein
MFQGSQITRTKAKSDCRFIIHGLTSRSRIHLLSIAGEGLQNLGLCSALKAFEQGGIFIMPHLRFSGLIRRTVPFCRILQHTRSFLARILCQYIECFGTQDKFELRQSLIIFTVLRLAHEFFTYIETSLIIYCFTFRSRIFHL